MTAPFCRFCNAELTHTLVDLGKTPLANSYVSEADLAAPDSSYPLHARICPDCLLVQVESVVPAEAIFSDYAYFSSYSAGWLAHAKAYSKAMIERFGLNKNSHVVELASNDGYLLKNFVEAGIPCLGIEPAANVAEVAINAGVPTEVAFFGVKTAKDLVSRGKAADLVAANNVLAHVPDLNDFVKGICLLLKPSGVATIEFPHLLKLIQEVQFDTIYHEHYCYFSLVTLTKVFDAHGLYVFDVEQLPTHGGSLRLFVARKDGEAREISSNVSDVLLLEEQAKLHKLEGYEGFAGKVKLLCAGLKRFLGYQREAGRHVVAYGAAAKGNTLLNVCGITAKDIAYVVDKNPHKQGHYLPGSRLPVYGPEKIMETKPHYVVILPWNIADEVRKQMNGIGEWGGRFVVAVPEVQLLDPLS
ncbi:MAG: class I SAM-dependent methyltransferase [Alphaproteobacteria bacterium]|nr:class I SAM-dependent methyltransferase [Alphaproteobacteria bacterium]